MKQKEISCSGIFFDQNKGIANLQRRPNLINLKEPGRLKVQRVWDYFVNIQIIAYLI